MVTRLDLTPDLITTICRWVEAGNSRRTAAVLAGSTESAVMQWVTQGRAILSGDPNCRTCGATPDEPCRTKDGRTYRRGHPGRPHRDTQGDLCARLVQDLETAEERCIGTLVATWKLAARDDWRAAEKFLARKRPNEWGERHQVNVTITDEDLDDKIASILGAAE
jgi:hypothetical protein